LGAAEFIRPGGPGAAALHRLDEPPVLWTLADGNPSWPVAGLSVGLLGRLKPRRGRPVSLGVVAPPQHPRMEAARRPVVLLRGDALSGLHPFGSGDAFVTDEAIPFVVALEQGDDFSHGGIEARSFACASSASSTRYDGYSSPHS